MTNIKNYNEEEIRFENEIFSSEIPSSEDENNLESVFFEDSFSTILPSCLLMSRTPSLVDELLSEIYSRFGDVGEDESKDSKDFTSGSPESEFNENSTGFSEGTQCSLSSLPLYSSLDSSEVQFWKQSVAELRILTAELETQICFSMNSLTKQVKARDRLRHRREKQYNLITAILQASSPKRSQDTRIRFSLEPYPGDSSYTQWKDGMKMVARLPEGIPKEFRSKLWLTLAERYLLENKIDWKKAERLCFNEWSNPDDAELGIQIVKDLHRTGCNLFIGEDGSLYQMMLKRVLLAYARWNKEIAYCQGFNMLAALLLEVLDKSESNALKVMIYMIEGVLPEYYFASHLRGLSVDIAVFRDLLQLCLPELSVHLDELQSQAGEGASGTSYEPPLTNVFTMQWFLTLFSTCLPRGTVHRVWDLILLEGNEILLRTALAIWKGLQSQILNIKSADEFYSVMMKLSQQMCKIETFDSDQLIQDLVKLAPFPFVEIHEWREKYTYNITPWSQGSAISAKKGLKSLYSDDENEEDDNYGVETEEDEDKMAFGISAVFGKASKGSFNTKERLTIDISALRKQYFKLKQRQKQAHIILSSTWKDQKSGVSHSFPELSPPIMMNHLLMGKKPLVFSKPRRGPIPGSIPAPMFQPRIRKNTTRANHPQPESETFTQNKMDNEYSTAIDSESPSSLENSESPLSEFAKEEVLQIGNGATSESLNIPISSSSSSFSLEKDRKILGFNPFPKRGPRIKNSVVLRLGLYKS